jgi:predicted DNA-binding transcriptional regulator AlpA
MTIREQLAKVRDLEYVHIYELALLTGFSERTLWRRLQAGAFPHVLRHGRVTTVHRVSALRALKRPEIATCSNPVSIAQAVPRDATA